MRTIDPRSVTVVIERLAIKIVEVGEEKQQQQIQYTHIYQ
jgi:hypothetical protein